MGILDIDERVLLEAEYIVEYQSTVRECGKALGVSKSTVHADMTTRLFDLDNSLYIEVKRILEYNYSVRHLRGGESTRNKYISQR